MAHSAERSDRIPGAPSPRPTTPHPDPDPEAATKMCPTGKGSPTHALRGGRVLTPPQGQTAHLHGPTPKRPLAAAAAGGRG